MEAIIVSSHAINQDLFLQKQDQQKRNLHLQHIKEIQQHKNRTLIEWEL